MGRAHSASLNVQPPAAPGGVPVVGFYPQALTAFGCNLLVEVATASAFVASVVNPVPRRSIQVMAHLDTGANPTSISTVLAQHLGLVQTGIVPSQTAGGLVLNNTYAVDILFVGGSTLASKIDLAVGSCTLPFTLAAHAANPNDPRNFGLLIGRDIMSSWHVTWDGPSACVIISD
jgi:hypothetical protein